MEWMFREQPVNDYGIDAQVEPFSDGPTGRLLALQIKAGPAYFKEKTKQGIVYRGVADHLDYWMRHCLPVIVVLRDSAKRVAYWQHVTRETIESTGKGWKMLVPFANKVDASCIEAWSAISEGPAYARRLRALVLAKPWMNIIAKGRRLILEIEEWIHKSSGRGSMKLLAVDDRDDEETVEDWPKLMFPGQIYQQLLPHLFPWAEIAVDEDYYNEYDEAAHDESCGIWDSEDWKYIGHTEDYEEWRARLPAIRPYEIAGGEVACFRLELTISALGEAFLNLDQYLESGNVSVPAETQRMSGGYSLGLKALTQRYLASSDDDS